MKQLRGPDSLAEMTDGNLARVWDSKAEGRVKIESGPGRLQEKQVLKSKPGELDGHRWSRGPGNYRKDDEDSSGNSG